MEMLLLALFGLWVGHLYARHSAAARAARSARMAAPEAEPKLVLTLNLEGVQPVKTSKGFVSQFGIQASTLADLRCLPGPTRLEELPPRVQDCLLDSYMAGESRGAEVAGLLFRGEELAQGRAVFFALCTPDGRPPELFTFVGPAGTVGALG